MVKSLSEPHVPPGKHRDNNSAHFGAVRGLKSIRRSPLSLDSIPSWHLFSNSWCEIEPKAFRRPQISQANPTETLLSSLLHHVQGQGCILRRSLPLPLIALPVNSPAVDLGPQVPWDSTCAQMPAWPSTTRFLLSTPCPAPGRFHRCAAEATSQRLPVDREDKRKQLSCH